MSTDHALRRGGHGEGGVGGAGRPLPPLPARAALAAPLPLARDLEARIVSLGAELPATHKAVLWAGVGLDVASKGSLCAQLVRFAVDGAWAPLASLSAFVALSSAAVTGYWLTHYPGAVAERAARARAARRGGSPPRPPPASSRAWVRRLGTAAAVLQLGTAFAAARALRSSEVRQRLVAMDLRGMRLADTAFLTLGVACLNAYMQVRCAAPTTPCLPGGGRAALRAASAGGAALSAALAHVALDLDDVRLAAGDKAHGARLAALGVYRATEAVARVGLLAVFAGVVGPWLFAVVGAHAAAIVLLLYLRPAPNRPTAAPRPWAKMVARAPLARRCSVPLPRATDACLLAACLAWPPSFFVSDATDRAGVFWWRARMHGRRSPACVAPRAALVPFWAFTLLTAVETAVMLGVLHWTAPLWAAPYVVAATWAQLAWGVAAAVWLSTEVAAAADGATADAAAADAAVDAAALDDADADAGSGEGTPPGGKPAAPPLAGAMAIDVAASAGRRAAASESGCGTPSAVGAGGRAAASGDGAGG